MDDMAAVVVRLISVELKVTEERVRSASSFRHDLGMDSIAAANILFSLEEEYGIELELDNVESLDNLEALVAVVASMGIAPNA
jgi:acyl carrier protein